MLDPQSINDMVQRVIASMPEGVKNIPNDVEDNLRAALRSVFSKLDLVTREEFDIQMGVLAKTRQKLETLEQKLQELEQSPQ